MKRKLTDETANSDRICEVSAESNSENVASSSSASSAYAQVSNNKKSAVKEEGASKRKRGRPRKAEPSNLPSTSIDSDKSLVENGKGGSTEVDRQRDTSYLQTVLGIVKEQKEEHQEEMPVLESSATAPPKPKQTAEGASDVDDVIVIHDSSLAQTSRSAQSTTADQSNGIEKTITTALVPYESDRSGEVITKALITPAALQNAVTVNCIVTTAEGSFEDFTQMTAFRTAQIIVRGRTLFVNPYALIEYSDIVANVVEKSGRSCKIQLDFMDFDDLQTSLRIFCRSPATGLKERLNDPNSAVAQKKYQALRSCSVFINVLKEVVECDDIPDVPTEFGAKENEAVAEWYVPSKYRKFELIPADAQAVFVNMELVKEYSPVLADSPAIFSDYCMLPQFTSAELITALNVLFRNPRTGRFHSVTLENMETLYKCAGLFDCLRPMCDAFSKGICVDAVIKADWYRLKCMLQIQATRRKCREPNRLLLADILSSVAGLVRDTSNILERLQSAGLADIPMGIGTALMVAVTEARAGCEQSEAMRLIL